MEQSKDFPQNPKVSRKHHYHSPLRRGVYALVLVVFVILLGTAGTHCLEGFSYLDSFYLTCMIVTGQGPVPSASPITPAGKIFIALLAIISVGVMVASFGFLFGPFLGKLLKVGTEKFEEEMRLLTKKHDKK